MAENSGREDTSLPYTTRGDSAVAHSPKPFFRTARNAWYVQLAKQQVKLHDGPKNTDTEKSAWSAFHA